MPESTNLLSELEARRISRRLYMEPALELLPVLGEWRLYPKLTMLLAFFKPHEPNHDRPELRALAQRALQQGGWHFEQKVAGMSWERREVSVLQPLHIEILASFGWGGLTSAIRKPNLPEWLRRKLVNEGDDTVRRETLSLISFTRDAKLSKEFIDHPDREVRVWAAEFGELDDGDLYRLSHSDDPAIRAAIASRVFCPPELIRQLCEDPDREVQLAAADRFWGNKFPDPEGARIVLWSTGDPPIQAAVARHLPPEHPWFDTIVQNENPVIRRGAAQNPRVPKGLRQTLLDDPDPDVQKAARESDRFWSQRAYK